jgi:hypothetical protein
VTVNCDRTVPEQSCQCPGIGTGDSREVHESRQAAVAPVGDRLVDQVGDENDLSAPEVVTSPEEDPSEEEEIIQDEVGGYIGGGCDQNIVLGEEVPDVAKLGEEKEDPRDVVRVDRRYICGACREYRWVKCMRAGTNQ